MAHVFPRYLDSFDVAMGHLRVDILFGDRNSGKRLANPESWMVDSVHVMPLLL